MLQFVDTLREFSLLTVVIRLLLALLLGGLVGLERERNRQAAGLRTHILVCTAATMTMLIGIFAKEVIDLTT
ncbi:MAG TPA: MgtC/SapB family protein, partial [Clostridia bacterium]|nr:MgtC/SapB family protein [Clostridia bacterium]